MLEVIALEPGARSRTRAERFLADWCPWMPTGERIEMIEAAFASPRFRSASQLGDDLKLTWQERDAARVKTFRPMGASDEDLKERRKQKDAEQKREKRRKNTLHPRQKPSQPEVRAAAIAGILRVGECCTVSSICDELKRSKVICFANLRTSALVKAVHRAVDTGVSDGLLEKKIEPGIPRGTTWIRRVRT
jgi:hypothetical protein